MWRIPARSRRTADARSGDTHGTPYDAERNVLR
jgi:hypothetical protein